MKYTLAVTSCGRLDLLKQTLESFCATADILPEHTIIVEDSGADAPPWLSGMAKLGHVQWIATGKRRGQIFVLDTLYEAITTELVFHTEDDWTYERGPFIGPSFDILAQHPMIWTVSLRGAECNGHPLVTDARFPFKVHEPDWRGGWGGSHFNPGARRMKDWRAIGGSYGVHLGYSGSSCHPEYLLSRKHLAMGYRIAALPLPGEKSIITHSGHTRSVASIPVPATGRILIAIPAAQRYDYGTRGLPVERISDGRVQAIRDTWMWDTESFPQVDARFFYGMPGDGPFTNQQIEREGVGLPDEVFLDCPDDYERLPFKVKAICQYALDHDYDFLVKCDDDTLLYVDRLLRSGFDRVAQMGWYGCPHTPHTRTASCSCYSTGMCYTLNKRCLKLVVAATPNHWAEDLWIGSVLRANGIRPTGHPGWLPGYSKHYVDFPLPPGVVAAHAVKPSSMRLWHAERYGNPNPGVVETKPEVTPCVTYLETPTVLL